MEESIEVVIAGYQKKSRVLSEKEKLIVSYHEVGHALVAALQTNSAPVTQDYHYSQNVRRSRLHHAGG